MYAHSLSPIEPIWSIKGCQVSFKEPQLENLILSSLMQHMISCICPTDV